MSPPWLTDPPPFLWPSPVLSQPEPQPGPLRTKAPAFRLLVSDATGPGTPYLEGGDGVLAAFLRAHLVTLESVRPGKTAGFQYTTRKLQVQNE